MHSLLLGNGINRVAMQRGWNEILQELARTFDGLDLIAGIEAKPLSMFIEELCARSSLSFQKAEHAVKVEFARLLKQIQSVEAHEKICSQFSVIMTTNYDFTIEEVFAGPLHSPTFLAPESRYSLFRRHTAGTKDVWHVHGDVARPGSMVLGFDHYAGYLQKIRNYVTDSVEVKGQPHGRVGSPVKGGNLEFTENRSVYSWVDYFLRDHIHIVGLGLDFTEIDLWWLLLHKRRRRHQTGQVFYYHVSLDIEAGETPVTSLLRSLSVNVVPVVAGSYHDCYLKVADLIERQIAFFPGHHPIPARCDERQSSTPMVASTRSAQGRLKFSRRKKLG
ncbi:SIR2 family protein [Pseudomonas sp. S2_A05]